MEKPSKLDDVILLIDFNSPGSKRALHTPLIPGPTTLNLIPTNSTLHEPGVSLVTNPFDKVVEEIIPLNTTSSDDPFECVNNRHSNELLTNYHDSKMDKCSNVCPGEEVLIDFGKKNCIKKEFSDNRHSDELLTNYHDSKMDKCSNVCSGEEMLIDISSKRKYDEIGLSINLKINGNNSIKQNEDSLNQTSVDFSSDEGIKAVIAKRVNKCIQKVLSNSVIQSKSKENEKCDRKSSTFTLSSVNCDFNKQDTHYFELIDNNDSISHEPNPPECSIGSCDVTPISLLTDEVLKNDDSIFLTTEEDEVFREANKLAHTFSKLADSFRKICEEDDDNLLTCKPQWLYTVSSEDEEEKLLKDPALNFQVSLTNSMIHDQPDSQALSAFRSRRSHSILPELDSQNKRTLQRSVSVGCTPAIVPVMPTLAPTVPAMIEKPDGNLLKLKRPTSVPIKNSGPMRAVIPVQNMVKQSIPTPVVKCNKHKSPRLTKQTSQTLISPIKDTSQLTVRPMASSTPNKNNHTISSVKVPQNKRHSFDSGHGHKSRSAQSETGSRQRSSSASSGSPNPSQIRTLGPRSTSNLLPNAAKARAQPDASNKVATQKIKSGFNPKALSEVKISRPSRFKSSVNAIASLVSGKSKKVILRDKENRSPAH